ncbi:MAG: sigma-70 family RNA polymerase sigma factor [Chloroflexota bacterium]|nr:sigma-70 family RNA polymerase sigma factor [Chloroflexota bacterium]
MCKESDSKLIARAKEDPETFGLLYERYVDRIYNYIYYRTSNHHDAEDLTARTFYRALKKMPRYVDRGAPFSAYLYRIAHNLVANWYRDNSRRQLISFDEAVITMLGRKDPSIIAEEKAQKKDNRDMLHRMIRQLPPDRQQLLVLKFAERMTNAEIGRVMGRTEGAIKSLYHRTLVTLRKELAEERGGGHEEER